MVCDVGINDMPRGWTEKIEPYQRNRKIGQYDLNDNLIKIWNSVKEISEYYNISKCCIHDCCKGRQKTSAGFIWKYYEFNN